MTAQNFTLAGLWAVIDRPYKGTTGTNLSVTGHSPRAASLIFRRPEDAAGAALG